MYKLYQVLLQDLDENMDENLKDMDENLAWLTQKTENFVPPPPKWLNFWKVVSPL